MTSSRISKAGKARIAKAARARWAEYRRLVRVGQIAKAQRLGGWKNRAVNRG